MLLKINGILKEASKQTEIRISFAPWTMALYKLLFQTIQLYFWSSYKV